MYKEINEIDQQHNLGKDFPLVYEELKALAHQKLRYESSDLTLNTTDLVHEAYMKMASQDKKSFENRNHFFAMASTAMRRILINYARQKKAQKRGGDLLRITMAEDQVVSKGSVDDILHLDEAMNRYQKLSERGVQIIEYWFFSGFKQDEIASMMDISLATVKREWSAARLWLSRELNQQLN